MQFDLAFQSVEHNSIKLIIFPESKKFKNLCFWTWQGPWDSLIWSKLVLELTSWQGRELNFSTPISVLHHHLILYLNVNVFDCKGLTCISLCFAGDCLKRGGSFIFWPKISLSENLTDEPAQNLLISFNAEWWIHSTHVVLDLFNPLRIKWRADIHPLCCIRNHSQKKHNKPTKWPKNHLYTFQMQ